MDRSMLTEIHGKNANGKTQNNTAQKDQTDDPLERLHADRCSIWLTLTRLDFARLSLLPWFKAIIMEQCAKCSSCQQGRTLLLLLYPFSDGYSFLPLHANLCSRWRIRQKRNKKAATINNTKLFFN